MGKKFNLLTGQWEDDSVPALRTRAANTLKSGRTRRKFNLVTGQWEEEEIPVSSISGIEKAKVNLGSIPGIGTSIKSDAARTTLFDVLGTGQYASAKFADTLAETGNPLEAFGASIIEAGKTLGGFVQTLNPFLKPSDETINPERLSYHDILKKHNPEFAEDYPLAASVLGFVGDIAFDPTTYATFGTATGMRIAGKTLSNKGLDVIKKLSSEAASDGFRYTLTNKAGETFRGLIGIDELANLRKVRDLSVLSRGAIDGDMAALNQLSTIINAHSKGFKGKLTKVEALTPDEIRWTVEGNFRNLIQSDSKLFIEGGPVGLFFRIPFSGGKRLTAIPPKVIDDALDLIPGLKRVTNSIKDEITEWTPVYSLSRQSPLAKQEEFKRLRDELLGRFNIVNHHLLDDIGQVAIGTPESRNKLANIALRLEERVVVREEAKNLAKQAVPNGYTRLYRGEKTSKGKITGDIFVSDQAVADQVTGKPGDLTRIKYVDVPTAELPNYRVANITGQRVDNYMLPQQYLDQTGRLKDLYKETKLTGRQIAQIRTRLLNEELIAKRITQDEFNKLSAFIDGHNKLADIEATTKLFKQSKQSGAIFTPETLGKGTYALFKKSAPEDLDLAVLYALRIKAHGYAQAVKDFDKGLESIFGKFDNSGNLIPGSVDIPKSVQREINYIGESSYSDVLNQMKDPWLTRIWGKANNVWKVLAYPIRPYAYFKQFIGNPMAGFVKVGAPALKAYDPRTIVDAMILASDNASFRKIIPTKLIDTVRKFGTPTGQIVHAVDRSQPDLVSGFSQQTRLGIPITGQQYMDEIVRNRVYDKGLDVLTLDQTKNLELMIAKVNGFKAFHKEKWKQGMWTWARETIPWINLPKYMENIQRVSLYMSARKMGMDEKAATDVVMKALFDYTHGTTKFEDIWMKRLVPFYTFQRMAIPLVASLVKDPGRAAALHKTTKEFLEVFNLLMGGNKLTPEQQEVLPGLILEQPTVFDGYDQTTGGTVKGVFKTFSNYVFSDFLTNIHFTKEGSVDWGRTAQKIGLSIISPFLKVPLEHLAGKQFFNNIPLGVGGAVESGDYVGFYDKYLPEFIKELIGYEVRPDKITGEKRGYINPYITYYMTNFFPAINDYVNITKNDLSPQEFAMRMLTGVGSIKLDFQKEQYGRTKEWQADINESRKQLKELNRRAHRVEDQVQLQKIIEEIQKTREELKKTRQKVSTIKRLDVVPK